MTYREEVMRTASVSLDSSFNEQLSLGAMGLGGESGEVVDLIKKTVFHAKPLDRTKLVKELGDVRWYMEYLMIVNKITMQEVEDTNVAKLRERYPNGFNTTDANNRKEDNETTTDSFDTTIPTIST